jgi:hypothetical protein
VSFESFFASLLKSDENFRCMKAADASTAATAAARCIAVKRFLPLGFPVQTNTDR